MRGHIVSSLNIIGMGKLAGALALAATLQGPLSGAAHAAANTTTVSGRDACEASGYMWSYSQKKCANKWCKANGQNYSPGSSRVSSPILGMKRVFYWCDGLTGQWGTIR